MRSFLVRLGTLDRRLIFVAIALAVIIPLAIGLVFPVVTTPIVQRVYDQIEGLPAGSKVLISADYAPGTEPENQPMLEAVVRHCMAKDFKVYLLSLWPTGPPMVNLMKTNVIDADFPERVEGEDWLNFGYKAGNQGLINGIFANLKKAIPVDINGTDTRNIPMMEGVERLEDFDLIVCIGSGFPGLKEWIQFGGDLTDVPVVGGVTAVEAPLLYPYYPHQLKGLMGGLLGAAEYEAALVTGYPQYEESSKQAIQRMGPQTVAHLVIILFILIGNLSYLAGGRKQTKFEVSNQ